MDVDTGNKNVYKGPKNHNRIRRYKDFRISERVRVLY